MCASLFGLCTKQSVFYHGITIIFWIVFANWVFHFFVFCDMVVYMKKVNYKNYVKTLSDEMLKNEQQKVKKLLSSMPLANIESQELTSKNVLHDLQLQKRLVYRNQFVSLAKRVSEISQHFRWNFGNTWLRLFGMFYKDDLGECTFDSKFLTLTDKKGGFINSLDAASLKSFNQYIKHYLQYIKENRKEYEVQNKRDMERMKTLGIYIEPDYNLREKAIQYANKKIRQQGFLATDVNFELCYDDKWKNYYINLKKNHALTLEQQSRMKKSKVTQLELEF